MKYNFRKLDIQFNEIKIFVNYISKLQKLYILVCRDVKTSYSYKKGGRSKNNPCGIYKLGLVGIQLLIVKSKTEIVFKVEF